ncbi:MAG TPA: adenylate/guanylate cyclase domain-containing protein [Chitinophagaceae bacterium]|jgi:class 3 adenylate cyclase|nr:adenylate/guanylate cyclase domain-containing protein [Chitinophagaceae bacterium]
MRPIKCFLLIFSFGVCLNSLSQQTKEDTTFVNDLLQQSKSHFNDDPSKALSLAQQAQNVSKKINFLKGEAYALKNMGLIYQVQGKYKETLDYFDQSLEIFERQNDKVGISNLLNNKGSIYAEQGDDARALQYCLQSLKIAEEIKDKMRIMSALVNIGSIYHNKEDPRAKDYLLKALPICEETGNKDAFGVIAGNIGEIYSDLGNTDSSLIYYQKALNANKNSVSAAYAYNGMGKLYLQKRNYNMSLQHHYKALLIAEKLDDELQRMRAYKGIANISVEQKDYKSAINYYHKAETLAEHLKANVELKEIYQEIAVLYSKIRDYANAFEYKTKYADVKDSLYNTETSKKLKDLQFDFDLTKKQGEINLLTKDKKLSEAEIVRQRFVKNAFAIGAVMLSIIAFVIYRNYRIKAKTNKILDRQKDEIEHLLLNILPSEVAKELQTSGNCTPRHYQNVSVLFTDFKGFTTIADKFTPQDLVKELNTCFMAFDNIIEKYGLEKIKTIGDSYMCAGGIPVEDEDHVYKMVKAGMEIQQFVDSYNNECLISGKECWHVRIGIHVGPVVAGVVGKKKYAYDIWGSTVNIASRMESNGAPGRVNISNTAYEQIKHRFTCSHRGKIHAKNVGEIDMYFVEQEIDQSVSPALDKKTQSEASVVNG